MGMLNAGAFPDSTRYDRSTRGRPFNLDEFFGKKDQNQQKNPHSNIPDWVSSDGFQSTEYYFGIGRSTQSADAADDDARLQFAEFVEVRVRSIATQQISEHRDQLEDNYSYESLVSTDMNLRSIRITERYMDNDSTFFSLIKYLKSEYHDLVTQEIQIALETRIRQQELAHQASEALRADSLRHKLMMDSLALGRKQAIIDSLDHILELEESRQRQDQARLELVKNQYSPFLSIKPHYQLIDIPSASTPDSWVFVSGRWNPDMGHLRQLQLGLSVWLFTVETNHWAVNSILDQSDLSLKLEVLPRRGDIYPVSLALGYIEYISKYSEGAHIDLRDLGDFQDFSQLQKDELTNGEGKQSSFFATGTVGLPQLNSHISAYYDRRRIALSSIWYPFPRNMGDAISMINQIDYLSHQDYRNRFNDQLQWQIGLRLIAIPNRFATMVSYEDHEFWMINFEIHY